jgi:hypothetical protein
LLFTILCCLSATLILAVHTLAPSDDHGLFRREVRPMPVVATIAKGYDLDYMWASTAAPAGEYYIAAPEAGEPPLCLALVRADGERVAAEYRI